MAFQIQSQVVIDNSRQIRNIGVATVGILSVTSASAIDGAMEFKGGASFSGASSLTLEDGDITLTNGGLTVTNGVLTGDGSGLTNINASGVNLDGTDISPRNINVTGISTLAEDANYNSVVTIDALDLADPLQSGLRFGTSGQVINEVSNDVGLVDAGQNAVPTEFAVKSYVDSQVGAANQLNITADPARDPGNAFEVDLVADQLLFQGTPLEVDVTVSEDTVTYGLAADVTISNDLTVTNNFQFDGGQAINEVVISGTPLDATNTDNQIPTAKLVYDELSSISGTVAGQAILNISAEDGPSVPVELAGGRLDFVSASVNDVVITATPGALPADKDTLSIGLAAEAKIATSLAINEGNGLNAVDLLKVEGSAGTSQVTIGANLEVEGDINSKSDARLKENIETIPAALEKVAALRGVNYTWKESGKESGGVIAQDVQAVMPNLIEEGEFLSVQYNGLVGLLIEAVKEQQAQIEELKAKLG